jgi:hypothetical protein
MNRILKRPGRSLVTILKLPHSVHGKQTYKTDDAVIHLAQVVCCIAITLTSRQGMMLSDFPALDPVVLALSCGAKRVAISARFSKEKQGRFYGTA